MHHPTDRITHTTVFVTPVVEHWLEWEIAQWVHPPMKDWSDDPSHHELTLLPRSYISLRPKRALQDSPWRWALIEAVSQGSYWSQCTPVGAVPGHAGQRSVHVCCHGDGNPADHLSPENCLTAYLPTNKITKQSLKTRKQNVKFLNTAKCIILFLVNS